MKIRPDGCFEDDWFIECSRVTIYANHGIIGINHKLEVSQGYDGSFDKPNGKDFTPEERHEIAAHMIDLWTRWGENKEVAEAKPD
jgi:hypothetical protein